MATPNALEFSSSEMHYINSKITQANSLYVAQKIATFSKNRQQLQESCYPYKTYPGVTYPLKEKRFKWPRSLVSILKKRRSSLKFRTKPLKFSSLSTLLLQGYGITTTVYDERFPEMKHHLRSAPSAGALYPVELYPICLNVTSIPQGCYHYHIKDRVLETVHEKFCVSLSETFVGVPIDNCSAILVFTALKERTYIKYGERGYRFLFLEAGHIAQNILLLCSSLGINACPLGAFVEDSCCSLLKINSDNEWIVYAIAIE